MNNGQTITVTITLSPVFIITSSSRTITVYKNERALTDIGSGNTGSNIGNRGKVIKEQKQDTGAPASRLNNDTEELKKDIFDANELSRIEAGETAKVILKVTSVNDSVSEEEKKKVEEKNQGNGEIKDKKGLRLMQAFLLCLS